VQVRARGNVLPSTSPVFRLGMMLKHDNSVDLSNHQTHSHTLKMEAADSFET